MMGAVPGKLTEPMQRALLAAFIMGRWTVDELGEDGMLDAAQLKYATGVLKAAAKAALARDANAAKQALEPLDEIDWLKLDV